MGSKVGGFGFRPTACFIPAQQRPLPYSDADDPNRNEELEVAHSGGKFL
jgi:hypothetical protein